MNSYVKRLTNGLLSAALLSAGVICSTAAAGPALPSAGPALPSAGPAECLNATEAEFLRLINDYRAENGVPKLVAGAALNRASHAHSKDMATLDYFDHTSQDGREPEDRMVEQGYDTSGYTGENIAAGYPTAAEVFQIWRDSPGHNKNMLSEDYATIGIGLVDAEDSEYVNYWTTDFGGAEDEAPDCARG